LTYDGLDAGGYRKEGVSLIGYIIVSLETSTKAMTVLL